MKNQASITEEELNTSIVSYVKVFSILILLTLLTFALPVFLTLEMQGLFITQMLVASAKAYFILAFYMHLKGATKLTKIFVMCAAGALLTFFLIVGIDSNMDDSPRDLFQTEKIAH